jgi:outer membrane protein OmpA-like peptidoglycan-associated protein
VTTPAGLPERRPAPEPVAPPNPSTALDLDRFRASAESALTAERAAPAGPSPDTSDEPHRAPVRWIVIGLAVAIAASWAMIGLAALGDDATQRVSTDRTTTTAEARPTAVAPTEAPTTVTPTTATTTTAPAPLPVDPATPPPHKAVYRDGKLYLEGRITSAAEAQKYIDKAAAVLGADNVVNNYVVDPAVPVSTDGTVYVDEPFLFETGSAALNPQYTGILGLGIAALRLSPAARMVVTGYTDNVGDPAKNLELSTARANTVVDYMVTTGGIDRARFDAVGAGDRNPVGDNATPEGRALNRRIDVKLVNLLG